MFRVGDHIELSASDLVGHLNCRHLTQLSLKVVDGALSRPDVWSPALDLLRERGAKHEAAYVQHLADQGLAVTTIPGKGLDDDVVRLTDEAMRRGDPVIVQAALRGTDFAGRADILLRMEAPSDLGAWSYEATDTKLARETKGGTVLQLSLYSDLLASAQGLTPASMHVVAPWTGYQPMTFRVADYAAYYRRVRSSMLAAIAAGEQHTYPEPAEHCEVCAWRETCDARRREDDHLSLVAGISKVQINELRDHGVGTVTALSAMRIPLTWKPERGSAHSMERVREQARLQCAGREAGKLVFELLPVISGFGLARLPEPSAGDIFLDLEGDPFIGEGGLEYLFGYAWQNEAGERIYTADWCLSRAEERAAFDRFVDFAVARLDQTPSMHIYHFAPYEPAALKRLMGRYASREEEVDRLLRSLVFVDLYAVVRHALRASVESYSIKRLEPLFGYERVVPLTAANRTLARVQACLELGDPEALAADDRASVEGYNRDDCLATWELRDWLEELRSQQIAKGDVIPRPVSDESDAPPKVAEWQAKIDELVHRLTDGVPDDPAERTHEQQGLWTLAHILDWHRRENKAIWWEHFRLADLDDQELVDERAGLGGLEFVERVGGTDKAPVHRYRYPPQDCDIREDSDLRQAGGAKLGKVDALSIEEGYIDIKKRQDTAATHPLGAYSHKVIGAEEQAKALVRIGEYVAENGLVSDGPYKAARDLILCNAPTIANGALQEEGETATDAAIRIAPLLGQGVLAIQGPPGAGKTYTGAHMIRALVGAKVGITGNSHKVIRNLVDEALKVAPVPCIVKPDEMEDDAPPLRFAKDNPAFFAGMSADGQIGGGTAWLWSRAEAAAGLRVLFVDEAAQMSLANVLAVSHAADALVLLGDPQQLDQPTKGSHPEGTEVSALTQLLGGEQTIPEGRGLFLGETWRLHPDICAFTSETFYQGRLGSRPGLEAQRVNSSGRVSGSGLRIRLVEHSGNQSSAPEEAEAVKSLVDDILGSGATWVNEKRETKNVGLNDILVIAPYNAQVFELQRVLPEGARVGTVDKFQGQQAAIVIYSMTTSSYADAPRGMEFLYSLNRLNVATSRAKCICVLVASPAVFEAECRTPRQMQLANAFCRYQELAKEM
ncbi:TM0106 family RecB-like putative nuclease [Ancylobacter aquaticus]|nr:TM0106 family RecB-like putative nuclease [Ancylobacter aquaticus]